MQNIRFYPGQHVILKSGGPLMTVNGISDDGLTVECRWFDLQLSPEVCTEDFAATVLQPYTRQSLQPDQIIEIEEGSVVRLRSDGPLMTVQFARESGYTRSVCCVWFDEKNRKNSSSSALFHPHSLVVVPGYQ
ncbi:YodC family protein [Aeromonas veronii]